MRQLRSHLATIGLLIGLAVAASRPAAAADLTVHIDAIRNDLGRVFVSVFDRKEVWLDAAKTLIDTSVPARQGRITVIFKDLPPGRYAVVTYHDENNNGKFDQNFLGLPLEGYAFSRNSHPLLSAPSFDSAAIEFKDSDLEITITMGY